MRKRILIAALPLMLAAGCGGSSGGGQATPAPPNPGEGGSGLDSRPQNLTCVAPDRSGQVEASIKLTPVFDNLVLQQPVAIAQPPGDSSRWIALEKAGQARAFDNHSGVTVFNQDFIDLRTIVNDSSEGGLLGIAMDPNFAANGLAYLSWTEGSPMVSVVARFTSADGGLTLDPASREDIIRIAQDASNHNGGQIAFGPDGHLYFGLGDGGSGGDPNGRAQDTTNLLGTMLRLDVGGASPYQIPAGNPFAGNALCPSDHSSLTDCPEIFAWGLRNPWRWSFDRANGALWLGDVGQGTFEEVDQIEVGRNYGWDCREASVQYQGPPDGPTASCSTLTNAVDPVHAYSRDQGNSVTGGYVYRGSAIAVLVGSYVFGDFGSGRIWRLTPDGSGGFESVELLDTSLSIAAFAEDDNGELYVVDLGGGIYRMDAAAGSGTNLQPVASQLSATGCFDPDKPAEPAGGLIPYAVAAPSWSDGANKQRWLALPDGTTIDVLADGRFEFPTGTVFAQHFRLGERLIETRLLMRHPDGAWAGYTYEWNVDASDAALVSGGKTVNIEGQDWSYPSASECVGCHTAVAGVSLGLEVLQLNTEFTYPSTGRTANQLETLDQIALFSAPIGDAAVLPTLPDPFGTTGTLEQRARAYLHTNCAQCHQPGGPTPAAIDLRISADLAATNACDAVPLNGDLGIVDARIIAPGEPDRSVLLELMNRRDMFGAMPPIATSVVDTAGSALIRDWIASLAGC